TFDDKADDYFARQQVLERLQGVELPEGVTPELEAMSSAVGEIPLSPVHGPVPTYRHHQADAGQQRDR
ncbi:hypothetical protein, partial [Stenotrophomonas maltophilia]|uniref:hypothetical protein n=1 Tax=Stenotrophomonas maltophilia TaxID=40324 RepID=UPI000CC456E0